MSKLASRPVSVTSRVTDIELSALAACCTVRRSPAQLRALRQWTRPRCADLTASYSAALAALEAGYVAAVRERVAQELGQ